MSEHVQTCLSWKYIVYIAVSVLTYVRIKIAVLSLEFLQLKDTKREGGKIGGSISEMFKCICQWIQHVESGFSICCVLRLRSLFVVCHSGKTDMDLLCIS